MNRTEKANEVSQLKQRFEKSKSMIFADYRGLSVAEITELRQKLSAQQSTMKVVKNRLAKLAFKDLNVEGMDDYLKGPTAIASSDADAVVPAKILVDFAKDHEKLQLRAGYMDGIVLDLKAIMALAKLPSREVLLAKMLGSLNAPASNLVNVLAAVPRSLVTVLAAVRDSKENA
ncbi:MAG: 50S ribosomal protein L10 [Deltaproteobacteria bacterium CG11_big_fil_rev_8_21_14_0_20_47_16]|nr:MAG: 50S ribosomal protein L10 [Deltaproteobacteria bacterium CG11_big_fil_rev_8_21_14_0_20_47_16]